MNTVLVTGANSEIGTAIVRRLSSTGAAIVATFHERSERLLALASEIEDIRVVGPFNICNERNLQALTHIPEVEAGLTGIVNGASYSDPSAWNADLLECSINKFAETFAVEVVGVLRLVQILQPSLLQGSSIVLFGSAAARPADMDTAVYNPAKQATVSLAMHLSKRLAPHTRVNVVAPGAISSEWLQTWSVTSDEVNHFKATTRGLRRLGTPEEVANVVDFLIGPRSAYVNAQVISVDGGSQA